MAQIKKLQQATNERDKVRGPIRQTMSPFDRRSRARGRDGTDDEIGTRPAGDNPRREAFVAPTLRGKGERSAILGPEICAKNPLDAYDSESQGVGNGKIPKCRGGKLQGQTSRRRDGGIQGREYG